MKTSRECNRQGNFQGTISEVQRQLWCDEERWNEKIKVFVVRTKCCCYFNMCDKSLREMSVSGTSKETRQIEETLRKSKKIDS